MPEPLLPDEPAAVRFMNTVWADRSGVHDALVDADDLRTVLSGTGTAPPEGMRLTAAHVGSARRLRDALRRLAGAVTGDDRTPARNGLSEREAVDTVNAALTAAPHRELRRTAAGWTLGHGTSDGVDAALAALACEGAELVADPTRPLRACRAPGCLLFFVRDHPRREWCSVTCGNRVRAARRYRRLRAARR